MAGNGLGVLPQAREHNAEVGVEFGSAVLECDRLADQFDGKLGVSFLEGDDTEHVKAVGMPGIFRQHLTVKPFRLIQTAGLVVFESLGEKHGRFVPGIHGLLRCRLIHVRNLRGTVLPFFSSDHSRSAHVSHI